MLKLWLYYSVFCPLSSTSAIGSICLLTLLSIGFDKAAGGGKLRSNDDVEPRFALYIPFLSSSEDGAVVNLESRFDSIYFAKDDRSASDVLCLSPG